MCYCKPAEASIYDSFTKKDKLCDLYLKLNLAQHVSTSLFFFFLISDVMSVTYGGPQWSALPVGQ